MVVDLETVKNLLYRHVEVVTNVRKSQDLVSKFTPQQNNDDRLLTYSGYLKSFDPITNSSILCLIEYDVVMNNILVLGTHIIDIRLSANCDAIYLSPIEVCHIIEHDSLTKVARHSYFQRSPSSDAIEILANKDLLTKRHNEIIAWLKENRVPADLNYETDEIIVAGCARIKPPYEKDSDYICPTAIVLRRLKCLIESRPVEANKT